MTKKEVLDARLPPPPPMEELPPWWRQMIREITREQHRLFLWYYMMCRMRSAGIAARCAGYSDTKDGARVRGHLLLHRPEIQKAVAIIRKNMMFDMGNKALAAAEAILDNPEHRDHAKAVFNVLDRTGFGPKQTLDVNVSGHVEVNHTQMALDSLREMRELGFPREKLVENFGYSGLERYERLLEEQDRQKGLLIEGKAEEVDG